MKHLRLAEMERKDALAQAVAVIRAGGVVLYPTDTVYGLGCDAHAEKAIEKLNQIKHRADNLSYIVLIDSAGAAGSFGAALPPAFKFFSARLWPGPVTFVLNKDEKSMPFVGQDSIAVRCPRWDFLRDFLGELQAPLVSTSANRRGEKTVQTSGEALAEFSGKVDLFLDFGTLPENQPSTIIDLRTEPPQVLRPGRMLQQVLDSIEDWKKD